jgi:hypothetical protein
MYMYAFMNMPYALRPSHSTLFWTLSSDIKRPVSSQRHSITNVDLHPIALSEMPIMSAQSHRSSREKSKLNRKQTRGAPSFLLFPSAHYQRFCPFFLLPLPLSSQMHRRQAHRGVPSEGTEPRKP